MMMMMMMMMKQMARISSLMWLRIGILIADIRDSLVLICTVRILGGSAGRRSQLGEVDIFGCIAEYVFGARSDDCNCTGGRKGRFVDNHSLSKFLKLNIDVDNEHKLQQSIAFRHVLYFFRMPFLL